MTRGAASLLMMNNTNATATQTEVMGYSIERTGNDKAPYLLRGPRGAAYGLFRYNNATHLMFVMRMSNGTICALKGNYTFTDADGILQARS